jgi:hypothetical protein
MQRGKEKREYRQKKGMMCSKTLIVCSYDDDDCTNCFMCEKQIKHKQEIDRRKKEENREFEIYGKKITMKFLGQNQLRINIFNGDSEVYGTHPDVEQAFYDDNTCRCKTRLNEDLEYFYVVGGLGNYDTWGTVCKKCGLIVQRSKSG